MRYCVICQKTKIASYNALHHREFGICEDCIVTEARWKLETAAAMFELCNDGMTRLFLENGELKLQTLEG